MNTKVIYTCLVGAYDKLRQPAVIYDDFDYICFSNDINEKKVGVWEIRPIPFQHQDKTRLSRYVKLNPHKVLKEYDYSIWIDANIEIVGSILYKSVRELINKGIIVAHVQHPFYDCIYKNIIECITLNKDKFGVLIKQYNFLKRERFPEHYGLSENNLIFRKHKDPLIIKVSQMWWELYNQFAKRDQFSLYYIYWKLNIKPSLILPPKLSTRNCSDFYYHSHSINLTIWKRTKLRIFCLRNRIILLFLKNKLLFP